MFLDEAQGRKIAYREDDTLDDDGKVEACARVSPTHHRPKNADLTTLGAYCSSRSDSLQLLIAHSAFIANTSGQQQTRN